MIRGKSTRLSSLQLVLLSNAAAHDDGSLLPFPEGCAADTGRIRKSAGPLLKRGIVEETTVTEARLCWRTEADKIIGLFITDAGRAAIGLNDGAEADPQVVKAGEGMNTSDTETAPAPAPAPSPQPRPGSKIGTVIALLERKAGATLDEMVMATGGQPHTTRAALTGLRKKGRVIDKSKRDTATCYRIAAEA